MTAGDDKAPPPAAAADAGLLQDDDAALTAALEGAGATAAEAPTAGTGPALAIGDLLADGNNEVVLFDDGAVHALTVTGARAIDHGTVAAHVPETGADVSGYHYVTFDGGLTLYFQDGVQLTIAGDEGA